MIRAKVNRSAAREKEYLIWNAYIDVLAMSDRSLLSNDQVVAHLAFWYDSEVQNGGHLQYLANRGIEEARDAVEALAMMGADAQRSVLARAIEVYESSDPKRWEAECVDDYCALALEGEFDHLDRAYYDCRPEMTELLQRYLDVHVDDLIEFTDERVRERFEVSWHVALRVRIRRFFGIMP